MSLTEASFRLTFILAAIACAVSDIRSYTIPNMITLPTLVALLCIDLADGVLNPVRLLTAGAAAAILYLSGAMSRKGMGMGDIKLAGLLGYAMGPIGTWLAVFSATVLAIAFILFQRLWRKDKPHLPYAPFLALGSLVAVLVENSGLVS